MQGQKATTGNGGGVWLPPGTTQALQATIRGLIAVYGRAGVGKSHLLRQLTHDTALNSHIPRRWTYDENDVMVWMAENSTATYGKPSPHIKRVRTIDELYQSVAATVEAGKAGHPMPKVGAVDSISGICDYQMQMYKGDEPFKGRSGGRDKLAEYADLGEGIIDLMLLLRDWMPFDMVVMVTTWEPGGGLMPELAVPGKVIPRNLTRLTSSAFYMVGEASNAGADAVNALGASAEQPHRTVGKKDDGTPDGNLINRYFLTQDAGEVFAKGHHNLTLRERAILPDVLRKIHGFDGEAAGENK